MKSRLLIAIAILAAVGATLGGGAAARRLEQLQRQ
jgi:hypothetical protein